MENQNQFLKETAKFWNIFYNQRKVLCTPSSFALWILQNFAETNDVFIDLGCGNGKDTFAFLQKGYEVIAIDGCREAISDCRCQLTSTMQAHNIFFHLNFEELDQLYDVASNNKVNCIYARFVLHAVPEVIEDKILKFAYQVVPENGKLFLEFRTIKDPLLMKGEILSQYERFTDHYRRFIDFEGLQNKLQLMGWNEVYSKESSGFAVFQDEDPVIGRIVAQKR